MHSTIIIIRIFATMISLLSSCKAYGKLNVMKNNNRYAQKLFSSINNERKPTSVTPLKHAEYDILDSAYVNEYGIHTTLYKHKTSGAEVMSVIAPDNNKVFGITFRTPPSDSTGVPHILEHSVLCGSKKYPSKEPFVDLLKGSLQTFLNAFTYPDRTCYPVASMNEKDFYNLINVYLDAVLHPKAIINPQILQQEGWHYELDDINEPLRIKGVVYNEMKGVYSSPESLLDRAVQQSLFHDNTYHVDSGGDPKAITSLTFEQFKLFHQTMYHPCNSKVFFYGDDDVNTRLNLLHSYLKDFNSQDCQQNVLQSKVNYQSKRNINPLLGMHVNIDNASVPSSPSSPSSSTSASMTDKTATAHVGNILSAHRITVPFPASASSLTFSGDGDVEGLVSSDAHNHTGAATATVGAGADDTCSSASEGGVNGKGKNSKQHMISVNWLLNDHKVSSSEMLALSILDNMLLGTSASILRKILLDSQLGDSVIGGLSTELLQHTYEIGLKNVYDKDKNAILLLIHQSLIDLSQKEIFDETAISASLNSLEFSLREFNTGSYPKGLSIMLSMLREWNYDYSPTDGILFENDIKKLKDDIYVKKIPIFQNLIKKYFLFNPHYTVVEMIPDVNLEENEEKLHLDELKRIKENMSPMQLQEIVASTKELKEMQLREDSEEVKALLPKLTLQDINKNITTIPTTKYELNSKNSRLSAQQYPQAILLHDISSSGILYVDVGFDYSKIDLKYISYLPLFSRMLLQSGIAGMDEVTLSRHIDTETGGVHVSYYNNIKSKEDDDITTNNQSHVNDEDIALYLMIRGKCTEEKIPILFSIMNQILLTANFSNQHKCIEMLRESIAHRESSVIGSGHSYGMKRIASKYSFLGYLSEHTSGLSYLNQLDEMLHLAENDFSAFTNIFESLRKSIIQSGNRMVVNLSGDKVLLENATQQLDSFIGALPVTSSLPSANENSDEKYASVVEQWNGSYRDVQQVAVNNHDHSNHNHNESAGSVVHVNEGFIIPSQVNYVSKGGPILPLTLSTKTKNELTPSFSVITRYLSNGYLWDNIRVSGGAYGGFASFSEKSGRFQLSSYRDPNVAESLKIYDNIVEYLQSNIQNNQITDEVILQSIIGSVRDLDTPLSPDQKGFSALSNYLLNEGDILQQKYRDAVLSTDLKHFKEFIQYLSHLNSRKQPQLQQGEEVSAGSLSASLVPFSTFAKSMHPSVVVFGSKSALEEANKVLGSKLVIRNAFGKEFSK